MNFSIPLLFQDKRRRVLNVSESKCGYSFRRKVPSRKIVDIRVDSLQKAFPSKDRRELQDALNSSNWNINEAIQKLIPMSKMLASLPKFRVEAHQTVETESNSDDSESPPMAKEDRFILPEADLNADLQKKIESFENQLEKANTDLAKALMDSEEKVIVSADLQKKVESFEKFEKQLEKANKDLAMALKDSEEKGAEIVVVKANLETRFKKDLVQVARVFHDKKAENDKSKASFDATIMASEAQLVQAKKENEILQVYYHIIISLF
jgi:hypothetical protein